MSYNFFDVPWYHNFFHLFRSQMLLTETQFVVATRHLLFSGLNEEELKYVPDKMLESYDFITEVYRCNFIMYAPCTCISCRFFASYANWPSFKTNGALNDLLFNTFVEFLQFSNVFGMSPNLLPKRCRSWSAELSDLPKSFVFVSLAISENPSIMFTEVSVVKRTPNEYLLCTDEHLMYTCWVTPITFCFLLFHLTTCFFQCFNLNTLI